MSKAREHKSSDVRSLRAMFESQQEANTPKELRGRSLSGHSEGQPRPLSRVRASFVEVQPSKKQQEMDKQETEHDDVQPSKKQQEMDNQSQSTNIIDTITGPDDMEIDPAHTKDAHAKRASTADLRRHEFSLDESDDSSAIAELKKTISNEHDRRASNPCVETIPEAAIEATPAMTPAVEAKDYMAAGSLQSYNSISLQPKRNHNNEDTTSNTPSNLNSMTLPGDGLPADNPDKPVSSAQEETAPMLPSDPKDEASTTPFKNSSNLASQADGKNERSTPAKPTARRESMAVHSRPRRASVVLAPEAPGSAVKSRRGSIVAEAESSLIDGAQAPTTSSVNAPATAPEPSIPELPTPGLTQPESDPIEASKATADKPEAKPSPAKSATPQQKQPTHNLTSTPASSTPSKTVSKPSPAAPQSTLSPKPATRKPSRASLTSSTAASQAKVKLPATEPTAAAPKPAPAPKTTARVPSRLTAPTAASAARQESNQTSNKPAAAAPTPAPRRPSTTQRQARPSMVNGFSNKPATATAPVARRTSTASRPSSSDKTTTQPVSGGFLARMMRPTASSAQKTHDKTEVKSPPRRTPSLLKKKAPTGSKPKVPKFAASTTTTTTSGSAGSTASVAGSKTAASVAEEDDADGAATPVSSRPGTGDTAALEATPAFDADTIR